MKTPYILKGLVSLGYNSVSKILPAYLASIGIGPVSIATINSSYHFAKGASGIITGPIIDRIGWIKSFRYSMALTTVMLALFLLFAKTDAALMLLFLGIGATLAVAYFSIDAMVTGSRRKSEELSKLEFAYQIGFVAGPIIGGLLALTYGFQSAVVFWIVCSLAGFALSFSIPCDKSHVTKRNSCAIAEIKKAIMSAPATFVSFLAFGALFTGFAEGVRDIAVPLNAHNLGMDIAAIGAIFTISAIVTAFGIVPLGRIFDATGNKWGVIIGLALMAAGFDLTLQNARAFTS
ncbi:MAG: MFS transporter [Candidatus Micrarchaeota archaeon]